MDSLALSHARRDLFTSNLPSSEKSALARVLSRVGGSGGLERARAHVSSTMSVVREGAEAGVVGAVIGATRAKFGTYVPIPGWTNADGSSVVTIPVEGIVAALGYGAAMLYPQEELAPTARRAANVAVALYAARKTEAYVAGLGGTPYEAASGAGTFGNEKAKTGTEGIVEFAMNRMGR